MKNHQKQRKFALVFDGIRVAFSHPLGLTESDASGLELDMSSISNACFNCFRVPLSVGRKESNQKIEDM